jgi:hypothetical protein
MLPVIVCPGCGSIYSLAHVPARPYQECAVCKWPFDPESVSAKYFDTTDRVQPEKAREPAREQYRADATLARQPFGWLLSEEQVIDNLREVDDGA